MFYGGNIYTFITVKNPNETLKHQLISDLYKLFEPIYMSMEEKKINFQICFYLY